MTTKKYLCSMWLEVGVPDTDDNAAAKAAFDKIWPGKIGSRWHNMLVEAKDDVEFLKKINNEFVNRAKILKSSPKGLMDPYVRSPSDVWVFNPRMGYWEEKAEVSFLKNGMAGVWQINIGDQRKAAIWLCMSASLLHTIGEDPAAKPRRRRKPVR